MFKGVDPLSDILQMWPTLHRQTTGDCIELFLSFNMHITLQGISYLRLSKHKKLLYSLLLESQK